MAVESRLEALYFVCSPRETRASRATNPRQSRLVSLTWRKAAKTTFVALHSTESRQDAAGVAVVGN